MNLQNANAIIKDSRLVLAAFLIGALLSFLLLSIA
jgi:hypothetical protein